MKDTLYYNCNIITMEDTADENTSAVLVKNGKIAAVGRYEDLKGAADEIDLKGATMLPGFIDGHSHLIMAKMFSNFNPPPSGNISSLEDLITEGKKDLEKNPVKKGSWYVGWGYDNAFFENSAHPTRQDLDKISDTIPIAFTHASGHVGVLNTLGLKMADITKDTPNPEGGVIHKDPVTGEPTGLLEEKAFNDTLGKAGALKPSISQLMKGLDRAQDMYASYGYTTIQDGGVFKGLELIYKIMQVLGKLRLDVIGLPMIDGNEKALKKVNSFNTDYKKHFRLGGAKLLLDGSPQAKTAWLTKPFYVVPKGYDKDYKGYPIYEDEKVFEYIKNCLKNDWQIFVHCNGDAASDQFINMYEKAVKETGIKKDFRPVMIHAQTVREDQLDKMKELGMMPSYFHDHTFYWGDYHLSSVLGPERGRRISPLKTTLERGIPFTMHQDTPVVTPNAIFAIHNAVNRITREGQSIGPEFRVDIMDALKAMTIWGAYQYHEEDKKGSIKVGKYADFVILDRNPLETPKEQLKDMKVLMTIKENKVVYKSN